MNMKGALYYVSRVVGACCLVGLCIADYINGTPSSSGLVCIALAAGTYFKPGEDCITVVVGIICPPG